MSVKVHNTCDLGVRTIILYYMLRCAVLSQSVASDSLLPHGYSLPGSSVHVDSPGKNTGVGGHALLQGIFPAQGLNPHCRQILYHVSHKGSPVLQKNILKKGSIFRVLQLSTNSMTYQGHALKSGVLQLGEGGGNHKVRLNLAWWQTLCLCLFVPC